MSHTTFSNADFPRDAEGRTLHLNAKPGEIANRICTVGSHSRAKLFSEFLDNVTVVESVRGYVSYTGTFRGVPISVIGTGMGTPMIDMMLREAIAITDGDFAIIRFGTCGSIDRSVGAGSICVHSQGSIQVRRNPNYWTRKMNSGAQASIPSGPGIGDVEPTKPYITDDRILGSEELTNELIRHLRDVHGGERVVEGGNVTADSYYSTQGRPSVDFEDDNHTMIDDIRSMHPFAKTFEMETFHLFDLARCSTRSTHAASAVLVLACRDTKEFCDASQAKTVERESAIPVFETLANFPLAHVMNGDNCVWSTSSNE